MIQVDEQRWGEMDVDTLKFFEHFNEPLKSRILEVGANEEESSRTLAEHGYDVVGVDLRPREDCGYRHVVGDFVELAPKLGLFDAAFSTSAIEHFGLPIYGFPSLRPNHDMLAMDAIYSVLKPGGKCYITVPYGRDFVQGTDWRVYNAEALQERIIRKFEVLTRKYFLSGGCECPSANGVDVLEQDANAYCGMNPHVTVLCVLRKPL